MREKILHEKGSFLRDAVFSASDGLVTTFAVVAGSAGASLGPMVVLALGFANLFADGFSMSSGTYLGVKSEIDYENAQGDTDVYEASPLKQAFVTFISFDIAGLIPLTPYILGLPNAFYYSLIMVVLSLFLVGAIKGKYTEKGIIRSGFEMFVVGGLSALVAFFTGDFMEKLFVRG